MKLKKIIATTLATVATCATFGFASCGGGDVCNTAKIIEIPLSAESYAVAVSKEDPTLLTTVNSVLEKNATEITAMIKAYENKEYVDDTPIDETYVEGVVSYTDSMANNDSYLVMATDAPFAPFEYRVGTNWGGIDVEIGKLIATEMGKTLAIKQTAFDTITLAVSNGDVDIGLAGLTITPARQKTVNFSNPYYTEAYQVVIVKENDTRFDACKTTQDVETVLNGLANGTKVGSQSGTTGAKYIQGDANDAEGFGFTGYANLTLKLYSTHADAVRDMINGQVSLCVVDNLVAVQIVDNINKFA